MNALCKEIKFDCDELVPVLTLDEISSALYTAYGQNTDKNVIDRARLANKDALEKLFPGELFVASLSSELLDTL